MILKLKEHPGVNVSKFTSGKFFVYRLQKCWILKIKERPKCKTQQVYRWQIFLNCLHKCWILELKVHPMCKHQHVYRWQFFGFMSAHVLDSQTKRTPRCRNQSASLPKENFMLIVCCVIVRISSRRKSQVWKSPSLPEAIFLRVSSAQVLDSQAKRSPKCTNQQVYRWQFFVMVCIIARFSG